MKIRSTALAAAAIALAACSPGYAHAQDRAPIGHASDLQPTEAQLQCITEQEVVEAQIAWGEGIVHIGNVYQAGGDYRTAAADHINKFYGYDQGLVLFKPTLAAIEHSARPLTARCPISSAAMHPIPKIPALRSSHGPMYAGRMPASPTTFATWPWRWAITTSPGCWWW